MKDFFKRNWGAPLLIAFVLFMLIIIFESHQLSAPLTVEQLTTPPLLAIVATVVFVSGTALQIIGYLVNRRKGSIET